MNTTKTVLGILLLAAACLLQGCGGDKETLSRGWIGGEYSYVRNAPALPADESVEQSATRCLLVQAVYDDSPVGDAGLRPGDLILRVNNEPLADAGHLVDTVEQAQPGEQVSLTLDRDGSLIVTDITVGKEEYQKYGYVGFGLGFNPRVNLWPSRFNIFGLLRFEQDERRMQLQSPEQTLLRRKQQEADTADDYVARSEEGYQCTLGIFFFGRYKEILTQRRHGN